MPASSTTSPFLAGVIEGFYGRPWNLRERHKLFTWLAQWGLNTYLYAPKDDLKHRARWREPYDENEAAILGAVIRECQRPGLNFIYALGPGLDIRYADADEIRAVCDRLAQLLALGCRHFALLFDDIPARLGDADATRFGSFAAAQSHVTRAAFDFLRTHAADARLLFCPTEYCARMAQPSVAHSEYLGEIGARLPAEIDVLWTGPEVVSETITVESIHELSAVLQRPPVLWDNLHANDYDLRRVHLGPYAGRPPELRAAVRGILCNPNCELEANFVPLRTFAHYMDAQSAWQPRAAAAQALDEWLPLLAGRDGDSLTRAELELLTDCFYLPHHFGARAAQFAEDFRWLLTTPPAQWGARWQRFDDVCASLAQVFAKATALENREALYAFYRYLWELKEEAALVRAYVSWLKGGPRANESFVSAEHAPRTYRGGLVAALQQLLPMDERGRFEHRSSALLKGQP